MTQAEALAILKTGANVFLTGEPGSGKTHTINQYVAHLRLCGIEPAITASTGIAATHIGGYTIHSWSGIGIRHDLTKHDLDDIGQNRNVVRRVENTRILIIDEISMLSARTLTMIDAVCREIRRNQQLFGGLQTILVGDFFQLPPVSKQEDDRCQESFVREVSREQFAFASTVWNTLNPIVCYLSEQHRQEDTVFLEFLSAMRNAKVSESHRQLLRTRYSPKPKDGITQLYSHNADVDAINDAELTKLANKVKIFEMESRGPEKLIAALKRGCLSPKVLSLKIGARVMFTKNDVTMHRYVNGTLGIVTGFADTGYPIVKTNAGRTIFAEPNEWHIEDGGQILARIIQVPLRLAWAMTVHKSQGMSLDAAHMDLSGTFEYGQGYVALSRVRTLNGLSLAGLNQRALEVHPEIRAKDGEFRQKSQKSREMFASLPRQELKTMHLNFIRACGGLPVALRLAQAGKPGAGPRQKEVCTPTLKATFALLKSGKSIREIARVRGLVPTTIYSHVFDLYSKGRIGHADIEPLASPVLKQSLPIIHATFKKLGIEKLKPVFEKLGGIYSYNDIRLARILYSDKSKSNCIMTL